MPPGTAYSLQELADLAEVTPRTVRYYVAQGLLPGPTGAGPGAHYTESHLDRIRLIKRLQRAHLPLAAIRTQVAPLDDRQVAQLAQAKPEPSPTTSAVDYIRAVIRDAAAPRLAPPAPLAAPSLAAAPMATAAQPALRRAAGEPTASSPTPDRSQWERIALHADVELHIRRPLTRQQNKRVDRLIAIARELLEEEQT